MMKRYNIIEHADKLSTGKYYTVNDNGNELSEQVYTHEEDALELCNHLNKQESELNTHKFLLDEKKQQLNEAERDRQVYLTLTVKLAKKLGFKGPEEFHDALCNGYLDDE
jgi:hypothetical protein